MDHASILVLVSKRICLVEYIKQPGYSLKIKKLHLLDTYHIQVTITHLKYIIHMKPSISLGKSKTATPPSPPNANNSQIMYTYDFLVQA